MPLPAHIYRIVRIYADSAEFPDEIVMEHVTKEYAEAHLRDHESDSSTASSYAAERRTATCGPWRDTYELEDGQGA